MLLPCTHKGMLLCGNCSLLVYPYLNLKISYKSAETQYVIQFEVQTYITHTCRFRKLLGQLKHPKITIAVSSHAPGDNLCTVELELEQQTMKHLRWHTVQSQVRFVLWLDDVRYLAAQLFP